MVFLVLWCGLWRCVCPVGRLCGHQPESGARGGPRADEPASRRSGIGCAFKPSPGRGSCTASALTGTGCATDGLHGRFGQQYWGGLAAGCSDGTVVRWCGQLAGYLCLGALIGAVWRCTGCAWGVFGGYTCRATTPRE